MKKLLFCYDGPIRKDEENQYYENTLTDELFKRYEVISNDISIAIRIKNINRKEAIKKFSKITKQKYKIIECPNVSSIKGLIIDRKKCKNILKDEIKKIDYVIARLPSMIGSMAVNIAKQMNKPYLIELVGCPWDALWNHSIKGKLFAPIMTYMTKKDVKNAPYVLYVTKKFLQKRYPTKGKSIGCSDVMLNNFDEKKLQEKEKQIINNIKVIATTAAINVKYKGQKYVIKAINQLKRQGKLYQYWIIGAGDKSYLQKFVKRYNLENQVKFLGPLPHDEVFKKLMNVDIYIQPSKTEGLPRALVEAMNMGCLCIGSRVGGIPELLDSEYIFKKGSVKQLIKIINNITEEKNIEQARRNFEKSKEYEKNKLQKIRENFYKDFATN